MDESDVKDDFGCVVCDPTVVGGEATHYDRG